MTSLDACSLYAKAAIVTGASGLGVRLRGGRAAAAGARLPTGQSSAASPASATAMSSL